MKRFYLVVTIIILSVTSFTAMQAQTCLLQGKVTDDQTSDPLPFVNIGIKGSSTGTFSDSNGLYQIELSRSEVTLVISCIGYEKSEKHVNLTGKKTFDLDIRMIALPQELSAVVVSGSKYEQKVENSISTIEVLKSPSILSSNPTTIDKAIDKIPGITIVDNEPQIRGGSGFSSGLGSRVMIMVDDIPILRGDAGRPDWNFLPVEEVDQIEVVKGASSVVYGSSAITGAVNIRTQYPTDKPETNISSSIGIYSRPMNVSATPWSGNNPTIFSLSVNHIQKVDNIDLTVGMKVFNDQGYIGGTPSNVKDAVPDSVFNRGEFIKSAKAYFNTRIRNKKIEGLTYGLNGNIMYNENAETYFWYDAGDNIYRSYPGALSHFKEFTFYADPYIKYFNKNGNSHCLRNRVYYGNTNANNNQSNSYITIYNEYQFTRKFRQIKDFVLVTGITSIYSHSYGQVFSGKLDSHGTTASSIPGEYDSENLSLYAQLEKKFFDRLTLLFGSRWEYYKIADFMENRPIFRGGINMRVGRATYLRTSLGEGYRAPSIGERYITTNSGGFGFYPNPDLKSETVLSYELGVKQLFRVGTFGMMADLSGFLENYKNYVEFNFGIWGDSTISKSLGFKFLNTGPARIYGIDFTLGGEGRIARNIDLTLLTGYTWSVPMALHPDEIFYTNTASATGNVKNYTYANTSSDTSGNILKYRIQHLAKADIQLTYKKKFSIGFTERYYGYMKNIDIFLYQLDTPGAMHSGIKQYRAEHDNGSLVTDVRISYNYRDFKFSFLVNNFFNSEYSLRPITIEAPRTTSLQVVLHI